MMAEFAAMAGSRRIEFLPLTLPQIDSQAQNPTDAREAARRRGARGERVDNGEGGGPDAPAPGAAAPLRMPACLHNQGR